MVCLLVTSGVFAQGVSIEKKAVKTGKEVAAVTKVKKRPCEVWHRKSFTPNGDGKDEVFLPDFQNCQGTKVEFWIVDHNGNVVFKSNNMNTAWDEKINNKPAPQDKYMWQFRMLENNKNWINSMGAVELIRETNPSP